MNTYQKNIKRLQELTQNRYFQQSGKETAK